MAADGSIVSGQWVKNLVFLLVIKPQKWPWFGWKYPLVNIQKTMEHHHVEYCLLGKFTISMAIFKFAKY